MSLVALYTFQNRLFILHSNWAVKQPRLLQYIDRLGPAEMASHDYVFDDITVRLGGAGNG